MTYTQLVALGLLVVATVDLFGPRLLLRQAFWVAYGILAFFQLLTNGWLTGREVVRYDPAATLSDGSVQLIGDWRLVFAPVEDLGFGLAMLLLTLDLWVLLGRRGVQAQPYADGPWQRRRDSRLAAAGSTPKRDGSGES
jgi:hypothetical protein